MTAGQLGHFLRDLGFRLRLSREVRKGSDTYAATQFSVLRHINKNEAVLSDILGDLLDPAGPHGQGDAFLRLFLQVADRASRCQGQVRRVRREAAMTHIPRSLRRMDILLEFDATGLAASGLAIENKPWAIDQDEQIADYVAHMKRQYDDERYVVVYLSGSGEPPRSITQAEYERLTARGQLLAAAYNPVLLEWVNRCYEICRADRVRWFLHDLAQYVRETFNAPGGGETQVIDDDRSLVVECVMESEDNLALAARIASAFPVIRRRVINEFLGALDADVKGRLGPDWLTKYDCGSGSYAPFFLAWKKSWPEDVALIGFENQSGGEAGGMLFGVYNPAKAKKDRAAAISGLKAAMDARVRRGRETDSWDWCAWFDDKFRHWDRPETIRALHRNEEAVAEIGHLLATVADIAAGLIESATQGK